MEGRTTDEHPAGDARVHFGFWRMVLEGGAVAATALGVFLVIYWPFGGRIRLPFSYGQDALFYGMLVRTMSLHGGYGSSSQLGAPFGQELYDFPLGGDRLHLVVQRALTLLTDDPVVVVNLYYAVGFVLISLSAYLVLRILRCGPLVAGCTSILFAFLPYHFWRGEQHLALAGYYAVPFAVLIALWAMEGKLPLTPGGFRSAPTHVRNRRLLTLAGMALLLGSTSPYYAVMSALLIIGAGVIGTLRTRVWRRLASALVMAGVVVGVLLVNLVPEILFRLDNGSNPEVARRSVAESDAYGLRLSQMLLADPDHRFGLFEAIGDRAHDVLIPGEGGAYLGLIGIAGFLVGVFAVFGWRVGRRDRASLVRNLGQLMVVAFLIGTIGGIGVSMAVLGFTQIRGWNRIVIYIGFMALTVGALLVDQHWRRRRSKGRRAFLAGVLVAVTIVGLLDQVPAGSRPDYEAIDAVYSSDTEFFESMSRELPAGSMVFQLPVIPFPEQPPYVEVGSYDHVRGYLLGSSGLAWSFGGLRGREADWQTSWERQPVEGMVWGLAAAGFDALYVDRYGYTDRAEALHQQLLPIVGEPIDESANGRMRWYDLRPVQRELRQRLGSDDFDALGDAVLHPVSSTETGIFGEEAGPDGQFRWMSAAAEVELNNRGGDNREVVLELTPIGPAGSHLRIEGGGVDEEVTLTGSMRPIVLPLRLAAGTTTLNLSTDAPRAPAAADARELHLQLFSFDVIDPVVEEVLDPVFEAVLGG